MLSVENDVVATKSRLVHLALLSLNLRLMENWRAAQISSARQILDYESLMILMAVIVISAERVLRGELDPEHMSLEHGLPPEKTGRPNLSSIAAATGINRETVRRKVNKLRETGLLARDKGGIRTVPGAISLDIIRNAIGAQLDAVTGTANQLKRLGILVSSDQRACGK